MKFIARVQNLHFNFSCHSLGCGGQIPSACLNRIWAARASRPARALHSPQPAPPLHPRSLGDAEDNCEPLFWELKESKAGRGVSQRLVAVAFLYTAALMAKQGLIFLTLQKFNGAEFFLLPINYTQGFT